MQASQRSSKGLTFVYDPPKEPYLSILYEDDDIVVADKPSGILSVPGRYPETNDSILTRIREKAPESAAVHRLDMSTSGILVVAKNSRAASFLGKEFIGRTVVKRYVAWVYGQMESADGEIDLPIGTSREMSPLHFIDREHGKEAKTLYHTASVLDDRSLVVLKPLTGRSHQLRLHLFSISHPILGDVVSERKKHRHGAAPAVACLLPPVPPPVRQDHGVSLLPSV